MADGGSVTEFCALGLPHDPKCEYFADGGDVVAPTPMPTLDVVTPTSSDLPTLDELSVEPTPVPTSLDQPVQLPLPDISELSETPSDLLATDKLPDMSELYNPEDYTGTGSTIAAGLEGAAEGALGFVAPMAENAISRLGIPSLSYEEQAKRAAANPMINTAGKLAGFTGSVLTGAGIAGLATKGAEAAAIATNLGKAGQTLLKGALSSGILQGSDEVSKILLGQTNPEDSVGATIANISGAGLLGLAGSAVPLAMQSAKIGNKLVSFLAGVGGAESKELQSILDASDLDKKAFKWGQKTFATLTAPAVAGLYQAKQGYEHEGAWGAVKGFAEGSIFGGIAQHSLKAAAPALIKILSTAPIDSSIGQVAADALNHATNVASGMAKVNRAVDSVFKFGGQKVYNEVVSDRSRKKIQDYVENGGLNQELHQRDLELNAPLANQVMQGFADGGQVLPGAPTPKPDAVQGAATVYPEQNMLMAAAKGRVVNYLSGLRPQPPPMKLAFDSDSNLTEQKKAYDRATDIAVNPLGVLEHARQGTLTADRLTHFKAMFPELDNLVKQQLTQRVIDMQLKGERPPSAVRQSLSLILGAPVSSEFAPQNIQAIQNIMGQKAAEKQQQPSGGGSSGGKGGMSKVSQSMQTNNQSLIKRQQRSS